MIDRKLRFYKRQELCRKLKKIVPRLKKEIKEKNVIAMAPEDLGKKLEFGHTMTKDEYRDTTFCLGEERISLGRKVRDDREIIFMHTLDFTSDAEIKKVHEILKNL